MRAIRPQRTPPSDRLHQLSRRPCTSRAQLEEELKLRTRPEEAYAEELVRLTVRTRTGVGLHQTRRMKCSLLCGSRSSRCSWAMRRCRAQHRCHVLRSLKLSTVRSCRSKSFGEVLWITRRQSQLESEPCEAGWSNPSRRHGSRG